MRKILSIVLALLASVAFAADYGDAHRVLEQLDDALDNQEEIFSRRQAHIDSLCAKLQRKPGSPQLILQIADAYKGFNNDSAIVYLQRGISSVDGAADYPFRWRLAALLPLSGFFETAVQIYEKIDVDSIPPALLASYYDAGRQMHSYKAAFFKDYPTVADVENELALEYQRKLLEVLPPESTEALFNHAEYYFLTGDYSKARVMLEQVVENEPDDSNLRARAAHHLSVLAAKQGESDAAAYFLGVAALADVLSATREVAALQELGTQVYSTGEISRAYRYLSTALENAVLCGAPLRMVESSKALPIIERAHSSRLESDRRFILWIIAGLGFMLAVLVALMLTLQHEMQKMGQLQTHLKAANNAKEVYISQFLQLCSIYMDKLNQFCKIATRKLAAGQSEELYRMTKSGKFIEEQSSEFYEVFDNAFLHIYPDFVDEVNALLRPECKIELKNGEKLNTDLRILAFMRLGIEESQRIAQVLNYSLNTIYSYRNRLKGRAINRDTFESDIMHIDSLQ